MHLRSDGEGSQRCSRWLHQQSCVVYYRVRLEWQVTPSFAAQAHVWRREGLVISQTVWVGEGGGGGARAQKSESARARAGERECYVYVYQRLHSHTNHTPIPTHSHVSIHPPTIHCLRPLCDFVGWQRARARVNRSTTSRIKTTHV